MSDGYPIAVLQPCGEVMLAPVLMFRIVSDQHDLVRGKAPIGRYPVDRVPYRIRGVFVADFAACLDAVALQALEDVDEARVVVAARSASMSP